MTVVKIPRYDYNTNINSGRGAVRLARLHGVQEVGGSNPLAPTRRLRLLESFLFLGRRFPLAGLASSTNPLAPTRRLHWLESFLFSAMDQPLNSFCYNFQVIPYATNKTVL